MARGIASARSRFSYDGVDLFTYLSGNSTESYTTVYNEASCNYQKKLEKLSNYNRFKTYAEYVGREEPYERVLYSKALLIYAFRQEGTPRLFDYEVSEMQGILSSEYNGYAEELLSGEISKLPQYYGQQTLINLGSGNIEQFLSLAAGSPWTTPPSSSLPATSLSCNCNERRQSPKCLKKHSGKKKN